MITDILIVLGIVLFVILGFRDGLFKKIFSILGFLGGLVCATKFMGPLASYIEGWLNFSEESSLILAFFLIFMFFVVAVNLFYRWFGATGGETLKVWSRLAGGILGAAQGAVAVSLVLLMFSIFEVPDEESRKDSALYQDTVQIAPRVFDYTTKWMPTSKKFFEELKGKIGTFKIPR